MHVCAGIEVEVFTPPEAAAAPRIAAAEGMGPLQVSGWLWGVGVRSGPVRVATFLD